MEKMMIALDFNFPKRQLLVAMRTMAWQGQDGNKNAVGTKTFDGILAAVDLSTEIT